MSTRTFAPRPLGVGDLLDETVRLYRRHFLTFIGIGAVLLVPMGVLELLRQAATSGVRDSALVMLLPVLTLVIVPINWLASEARLLAATFAVSEIYLGRRPTIRSAYSGGLRRFAGAVGLSILVGLAVVGMGITVIGIPFAIFFGLGWSVALQALLLEGVGIRRAMGRSRELVRGGWWRVFGIVFLLLILQWVIEMAISIPSGIALGAFLVSGPSSNAPLRALHLVLSSLFGTVSMIVAEPILFCGLVLLYYDLRIRKEGFDLELLARRASESAVPDLPPA